MYSFRLMFSSVNSSSCTLIPMPHTVELFCIFEDHAQQRFFKCQYSGQTYRMYNNLRSLCCIQVIYPSEKKTLLLDSLGETAAKLKKGQDVTRYTLIVASDLT